MGSDAQRADLECLARVALDELHLRGHVAQAHREVGGVGLIRKRRLQRLGGARRSDDGKHRARHERGQKKWKALDVIEVRVRDQEVRLQRFGRAERAPELCDAGTRIDDEQVVLFIPDLDARRVAAVAKGAATWGRPGAARAPELDPHRAPAG